MATRNLSKEDTFTSTAELRAKAKRAIADGPVTASFPADREVIIARLNLALATEWVCVMRYLRHYYTVDGPTSGPIKAHFLEHAQEEQAHADKLAERIVQLGGDPDLDPATLTKRSHAEYTTGETIEEMIRENLIAERIAVDSYRELVQFLGDRDPTTRALIESILAQEEEHADELRDLLP